MVNFILKYYYVYRRFYKLGPEEDILFDIALIVENREVLVDWLAILENFCDFDMEEYNRMLGTLNEEEKTHIAEALKLTKK